MWPKPQFLADLVLFTEETLNDKLLLFFFIYLFTDIFIYLFIYLLIYSFIYLFIYFFSAKRFVCWSRVQFSVWSLTRLVLVEGQLETQASGQLLVIWKKNRNRHKEGK